MPACALASYTVASPFRGALLLVPFSLPNPGPPQRLQFASTNLPEKSLCFDSLGHGGGGWGPSVCVDWFHDATPPLVAHAWVRVQNVAPVVVDGWVGGAFPGVCFGRPVPTIHTCDRLDWLRPEGTGIMPFDLHCSPLFLLSSLRDLHRP